MSRVAILVGLILVAVIAIVLVWVRMNAPSGTIDERPQVMSPDARKRR